MQMADIYESQNQIQKTMFENIALNRLLENDSHYVECHHLC